MSDATPTPETPEPAAPQPAPEPVAAPAIDPQQDALNRQFAERADRAARSREKEILTTLGVESLDSAAKLIEDANRIKAEQMTEVEKAQKAAEELAAKNAELEATLKARDLRDMRLKVAAETGLPEVLAAKLADGDEESMIAEAKALIAAIPAASQGLPDAAGSVPPSNTADAPDPFVEGMLSKAKTR